MDRKTREQTEFYAPFAHIPGCYEWCRIHCPSHGSFDTFIVIETETDEAVTVYVASDAGAAFMADRYPESRCIRVPEGALSITADASGRRVEGFLESSEGPVSLAEMTFEAPADGPLADRAYGGEGHRVWGGRWSCAGVDLEAAASVSGRVVTEGRERCIDGTDAVLTLGSYGTIRRLEG